MRRNSWGSILKIIWAGKGVDLGLGSAFWIGNRVGAEEDVAMIGNDVD